MCLKDNVNQMDKGVVLDCEACDCRELPGILSKGNVNQTPVSTVSIGEEVL
jgi:hypothetical protein